jgi:hypothetical protein
VKEYLQQRTASGQNQSNNLGQCHGTEKNVQVAMNSGPGNARDFIQGK